MKYPFVTSEKQLVRFPSLCQLSFDILLRTHYLLCFEMLMELVKAFARWWSCTCLKCVSGLLSPKKFEFFEIHTCLWPGAPMFFKHELLKLHAAFLSLLCIDRYSCLRCWNDFFLSVLHVLDWIFFSVAFCGNFCNWFPNLLWSQMDWVWGSFLDFWLYSLTLDLNRREYSKMLKPMSHLTT